MVYRILIVLIIPIFFKVQSEPQPAEVIGADEFLFGIKEVLLHEDYRIILAGDAPFIHIYKQEDEITAFGDRGRGPFEFQDPKSFCTDGTHILILDAQPGKNRLITFSFSGEHISESLLEGVFLANKIVCNKHAGLIRDSRLNLNPESGVISGSEYNLHRLSDMEIIKSVSIPGIRVKPASGIRSLTVPVPFNINPVWAFLPDGRFAWWEGAPEAISVQTLEGVTQGEIRFPLLEIRLTKTEIDNWLEKNYAEDTPLFGAKGAYAGVKDEILRKTRFPKFFPQIAGILPGAGEDLWLLRARTTKGDIWTQVKGNKSRTYRFDAAKSLVTVGAEELAFKVVDDEGYERIEIFKTADLDFYLWE